MSAVSHWQLPVFRELRLEESSIFGVREGPTELMFEMEFVLGERHPRYRPPAAGQERCYRKGRLTFHGVSDVNWSNKRIELPPGASADADLGTIDSFLLEAGAYKLRGAWGRLELRATSVDVDVW
jgi:hypothetical protein